MPFSRSIIFPLFFILFFLSIFQIFIFPVNRSLFIYWIKIIQLTFESVTAKNIILVISDKHDKNRLVK